MSSKSDFEFIPTRLNDLWNYLQKKIFIFHVQFCCCFSFNWLLDYSIPSPVLSLRKLQCKSAILTKISYLNNSLKLRREWKTWKSRQTSKKKKLKRENIWNSTEKNIWYSRNAHTTRIENYWGLRRYVFFFRLGGKSAHTRARSIVDRERERSWSYVWKRRKKSWIFLCCLDCVCVPPNFSH